MRLLKDSLPYLVLFLLGAFAASSFSPFATISRQGAISAIDSTNVEAIFPLKVGTVHTYEGWIRQQQGQEQDPPKQTYRVIETVVQQDKAHDADIFLTTVERQEQVDGQTLEPYTIGYFQLEGKIFRLENEEFLNVIRQYLYGDAGALGILTHFYNAPTYEFPLRPNYYGLLSELLTDKQFGYEITASSYRSPLDKKADCFELQDRQTSSAAAEIFCNGIGPVKLQYTHHGTIDEYELNLVELSRK